MKKIRLFLLPSEVDGAALMQQVAGLFAMRETGHEVSERLFLDTFDWRLFRKDLALSRCGRRYTLEGADGGVICSEPGSRKKHPFSRDFSEEGLGARLAEVAGVRALLPQFKLKSTHHHFVLLNREEKIVLRLTLVDSLAERYESMQEMPTALHVIPLKGYAEMEKRMCELLLTTGLEECACSHISRLQTAFGVDPAETDSKFTVSLHRDETVGQVTRDICLILKGVMVRNIPGIQEDIDPEFLHDFRVSIRRTRSLLSVLKKQLPTDDLLHFREEFKWLGTVTGPVRDLDVYLLRSGEYRSILPELLHPGLQHFFDGLSRQRKRELRRLREHLSSERTARLLESWEEFLLQLPGRTDCPESAQPGREVAVKLIRKWFKKLLKTGAKIGPKSPYQDLHTLRIEGKKFRYLLEFFRSLFQVDAVDTCLKQMKKFQNILGDYNDLSVQIEMLSRRLNTLGGSTDYALAAALGGLIVHMTDERKRVRQDFDMAFQEFTSKENLEMFEQIFAGDTSSSHKTDPS